MRRRFAGFTAGCKEKEIGLPVKDAIPPEQALLFVEETRGRFPIVSPDN